MTPATAPSLHYAVHQQMIYASESTTGNPSVCSCAVQPRIHDAVHPVTLLHCPHTAAAHLHPCITMCSQHASKDPARNMAQCRPQPACAATISHLTLQTLSLNNHSTAATQDLVHRHRQHTTPLPKDLRPACKDWPGLPHIDQPLLLLAQQPAARAE
jgi:hypothetical protein